MQLPFQLSSSGSTASLDECLTYHAPSTLLGTTAGPMPSGTIKIELAQSLNFPGSPGTATIQIIYSIPSGTQLSYHDNPGNSFKGTTRVAYLPDNNDGRMLLTRLKYAWNQGLIFTIGTSMTTGERDVVTWSTIPHKTSLQGGPFGWPDPNYFTECNAILDLLQVPGTCLTRTTSTAAPATADDPGGVSVILAHSAAVDESMNEMRPSHGDENDGTALTSTAVSSSPQLHHLEASSNDGIQVYSENEYLKSRVVPTVNSNGNLRDSTSATMPAMIEDDTDARFVSAVEEDVMVSAVDGNGEQPATVVSVEALGTPATATVVATVEECSDDAVIRQILAGDLIASGRSTTELQEYIKSASLENVMSMMAETGAHIVAEEEKKEFAEPDSAVAWAHDGRDYEQSVAKLPEPNDDVLVATLQGEQATVVTITDHDDHNAEFSNADAQAEFIGQDYSVSVVPEATTTSTSSDAVVVVVEEETAAEATVLDSKPAAVPSMWSGESAEEATVLETNQPGDELWSRRAEDEHELTVDAIVEEEATVVGITEDVHPAEFEANEGQATLIGRDFTRTVSFSTPSPAQRPRTAGRAISDPPPPRHTNPLGNDTSDMFQDGIAALDAIDDGQNWMDRPPSFYPGDEVIMPPPATTAVAIPDTSDQTNVLSPMAAVQVVDADSPLSQGSNGMSQLHPLPAPSGPPARVASRTSNHSEDRDSLRSSGSSSARRASASIQLLSTAAVRGTSSVIRGSNQVIEMLFGEKGPAHAQQGFNLDSAAGPVLPRTLLPWSVFPNESSGMWVATVNTNQKALDSDNVKDASKALRAFSCMTQAQAEALARAWAPPRMMPFSDNPVCFICESKFAIFKRACHCRNCGVCVCANCIIQWPSKMLPATYNIKKESMFNICKSCDWLCSAFRLALLYGQHDQAVAIHATGNINLVTPFANVKGELFYPVHCAVLGSSLSLLKWLVDEHCCPVRSIRVAGRRREAGTYMPILTSRGRSLLGIAMENENLEIVRYLVVDKRMSLAEEKNLTMETTIRTLEAALHLLPSEDNVEGAYPTDTADFIPTPVTTREPMAAFNSDSPPLQPLQEASPASTGVTFDDSAGSGDGGGDDGTDGSVDDDCIICCANPIDCVLTPCGHQICCMQCSTNISRCPVCSAECSFMRVYRR